MLLLAGDIKKQAIVAKRAAESESRLISPEEWTPRPRLCRYSLPAIQTFILREQKGITVNVVRSGLRNDIDRASGGTPRFGRKPIINDLEFPDDFRRQRN